MEYKVLARENAEMAEKLFLDSLDQDGLVFKPFSDREAFLAFFLPQREETWKKVSILTIEGTGFASGCYVPGEERAYITFLAVNATKRRKKIGTGLLRELEKLLFAEGALRTEIVFFNPMTFSWLIPGEGSADHPNAPGMDVAAEAYLFFKNCGYRDYAMQNSYYLKLSGYQVPEEILPMEQRLSKEGITFEIYAEQKHTGLEELIHGFQNPMWDRDILGEVTKGEESRPILIVSDGGKAVAFAGPLDVEEGGRGYFAGIGVDASYRGRGIAKILFCKLCVRLKERDAQFMTLFTGENNPARNIYEAAGFHIVRTWADMRREKKRGADERE